MPGLVNLGQLGLEAGLAGLSGDLARGRVQGRPQSHPARVLERQIPTQYRSYSGPYIQIRPVVAVPTAFPSASSAMKRAPWPG